MKVITRGTKRERQKWRRKERRENFLKLHSAAPERPYTGISTPTARDNEANSSWRAETHTGRSPVAIHSPQGHNWYPGRAKERRTNQETFRAWRRARGKNYLMEGKPTRKGERRRTTEIVSRIADLPKLRQRPPKRRLRIPFPIPFPPSSIHRSFSLIVGSTLHKHPVTTFVSTNC